MIIYLQFIYLTISLENEVEKMYNYVLGDLYV